MEIIFILYCDGLTCLGEERFPMQKYTEGYHIRKYVCVIDIFDIFVCRAV